MERTSEQRLARDRRLAMELLVEQTYRFPVEGSGGLEAIKSLAGRLVPEVEQVFLRMKEARAQSLQADSPENPAP